LIDMSEPDVTTDFVKVLLPPADVPPTVSLVAPVCTDTVDVAAAVGMPDTVHEMLAPMATVAGGDGTQLATVTPAGRPLIAQVAFVAGAVAVALLVQRTVPEYAVPTVAAAGNPVRFGVMSAPVTAILVVAVLLAAFGSLVAPVNPDTVEEPSAVGVPETVHVITPLAAKGVTVGTVGAQTVERPAGRPVTEHKALVAASAGDAALVQVNVPL
jgi:hypothetical protein